MNIFHNIEQKDERQTAKAQFLPFAVGVNVVLNLSLFITKAIKAVPSNTEGGKY